MIKSAHQVAKQVIYSVLNSDRSFALNYTKQIDRYTDREPNSELDGLQLDGLQQLQANMMLLQDRVGRLGFLLREISKKTRR